MTRSVLRAFVAGAYIAACWARAPAAGAGLPELICLTDYNEIAERRALMVGPTAEERSLAMQEQRKALDSQLDDLREHEDEFVLFMDKRVVSFHKTFGQAYGAGIDQFGLDGMFLISAVHKPAWTTPSITWAAGAL